jgi:hypothetical protein
VRVSVAVVLVGSFGPFHAIDSLLEQIPFLHCAKGSIRTEQVDSKIPLPDIKDYGRKEATTEEDGNDLLSLMKDVANFKFKSKSDDILKGENLVGMH